MAVIFKIKVIYQKCNIAESLVLLDLREVSLHVRFPLEVQCL